jgi:DNA topoisomerase VI subunit B
MTCQRAATECHNLNQIITRTPFKTSRLAEFTSEKELINQTGHDIKEWPIVVLKELVDNSLDACEEARIAPVITITVDACGISVSDNGPGITPVTVTNMLDYSARVSSREAYVAPTRGAQGNALKTIIAMPFALTGEAGRVLIRSREVDHEIILSVDRIRQEPKIAHVQDLGVVKFGTEVLVEWPNLACSIVDDAVDRFLQVVQAIHWANPHLDISLNWNRNGRFFQSHDRATNPSWRKWTASDPTPASWYDADRLARLIGANISHAEDSRLPCQTVREFVSEFKGLSGTAKGKAICDAVGASRLSLREFFGDGEDLDSVNSLLNEMIRSSKPIKPRELGVIGRDHILNKFEACRVDHKSFDYQKNEFEYDGLPYVIEVAFGYCPNEDNSRRIVTGINWTTSVGADPFRQLGPSGQSLDGLLTAQRAKRDEPIVIFVHLACPRIQYLDRGKSNVSIPYGVS